MTQMRSDEQLSEQMSLGELKQADAGLA